jgi:Fe-S cluster assembly protein SufD
MKPSALSIDALSAVVGGFPDDGLAASRLTALEQVRSAGLPNVREENWKYTDLAVAVGTANAWLESGAAVAERADSSEVIDAIDADWIVIDNGRLGDDISVEGIEFIRFSQSNHQLAPSGRLGDLNIALLQDGLHVAIGAGIELERPLGILINDQTASGPGVSQVRVDIDLAANASASIIEFHRSAGEAEQYSNSVINLKVGDGARVGYVRIQDRASNHTQTGFLGVSVGRDARFEHAAFDFGGHLVRNDVAIDLTHPGSRAEFRGLYLVGDGQHIDNHTRVDHRVGPAQSQQEYRGILTGKARGVWNGKAIVHEGADGTDAEQANHNLLLSEKAEINAKPELEIYADDVKCSHGTTVGQLDEIALFYLRSRGLSRSEARQLLTRAFAQAIVSQSPLEVLHEYLTDRIASRLDELMQEADL